MKQLMLEKLLKVLNTNKGHEIYNYTVPDLWNCFDYNPTKFQQSVYNETVKIPFGEVITYKELAIKINNPKAIRAVGGALGKNQFPILIPCHRIIGSNGKLTGFSAIGGIQLKKRLINFEQEVTNEF